MDYITVQQAAQRWNISNRRVRLLCAEGKIAGTIREGRSHRIFAQYVALFASADELKNELDHRHSLTDGGLKRLQGEFLVEFTCNSNAIERNTLL
jgi:hypothetical protein